MLHAILLLLVGLLTAVYMYFHYNYKYWLKKGITQENPTFMFGSFLDVILNKKNPGWIYNELYYKYKNSDAVGLYEFQTPSLLVRTPELFETILVKDFASFHDNEVYANLKHDPFLEHNPFLMRGEKWKPARNSIISGFTKGKLINMYELMKQTVPCLKSYIENNLDSDIKAFELALLFMMTNVSNTVFGIESNCFIDPNAMISKMVHLNNQEHWQTWWQVIILFKLQRLRDILGFSILPKKVSTYVENMVRQVIDARLKNNIKRNDFLNYYLNLSIPLEDKIIKIIKNGMAVFSAGFETSSLPSGNLMYELALNPDIQENLYQELQEAYGEKSDLTYDTLMTLPLLDRAFKEILRKYPILYSATKVCTKETTLEIDGKPVKINKGDLVVIPTTAVHHDPQYYPDPEVFDPERFSEEAMQSRHPRTWLPFGAGPRICAGMKFGLLQAKLLVASIVYSYKIERTERTPPGISMRKSAFLAVPEESQWICLVKRR